MSDSRATSFHQAADAYARARPSYLPEAVAWMLPDGSVDVADVGAGTGKLSAVIARTGRRVVAIDPDAGMLEKLRADNPGIRTEVGSAEALPLGDGSVDVVTFGQAWHWVEPLAATAEVARVLEPGGTLGLIWNIRDESVPWVAALTRAMHGSHAETMLAERRIEREWVDRTLHRPDEVRTDLTRENTLRAFRSIPERDGRVLRVVYSQDETEIRVITAFFDRAKTR